MSKFRHVVKVLVVCLCLAASGRSFADTRAAEQQIGSILDGFEKVYLAEDLELISSLLSDNGYAIVMRRQDDPSTALVLGKAGILQVMERRFQRVDYREHRHVDRRIQASGYLASSVSTIVDRMADGTQRESLVYHIYACEEEGWKVVFTSDLVPGD